MASAQTLLRYWHTLRHLKPAQFIGRVRFRLARPRVDVRPAPPLRERDGAWYEAARRRASLEAPGTFRFLNVSHALSDVGWDGDQVAKLWRYNQHYFEDLHGLGAEARTAWHHDLVARWIRDNPPARGTGWEPYPSSLRIVNWIKWAWQGQALSSEAVHSLAVQARWLTQRLEWHLLGNHLFVNAKALVFAGLFFEGPEADAWFEKGLHILRREVPEQILKDGGQFERSPMYHALALEDLLDLWNASRACAKALRPADAEWFRSQHDRIESMRRWLSAMTHPDGEIALFNDAAIGIAPSPAALEDYAGRLGFAPLAPEADGFTHLEASGFIRVQQGPMVAMLDVGPIGPDYLPGHAHADTLSFELSLHGRRVLVNSGTSVYGIG
ncbi:MAG: heparinase II/III domain-containing protein, partial [Phycisphaerales bacterium]